MLQLLVGLRMDKQALYKIIKAATDAAGLEYRLMCALVSTESSFNPNATRFEAKITRLHTPEHMAKLNNISLVAETTAQRTSYGLGQVLGVTARSQGYRGFIPKLMEPELGMLWACKVFIKNGARYKTIPEKLAAYNAGSVIMKNGDFVNRKYVDKVLSYYEKNEYKIL